MNCYVEGPFDARNTLSLLLYLCGLILQPPTLPADGGMIIDGGKRK
jgi:hypothetical protein